MFTKPVALAALAGLVGVSASSEVHQLVTRQISSSQIPSACQSQCTSALSIYQACLNGDTTTCLSVCQSSNYSGFVGCFQCVLNNTPGVTSSDVTGLQGAVDQLASACNAAGSSVASTSLAATNVAAASGSASGIATSGGLDSITSAASAGASGITIGASSSSAASSSASSVAASLSNAGASVASSASGAVSSAASAAAASSSKAAGFATAQLPTGLTSAAVGLVGVIAGAAFML
ncbi:hypothetical protein EHS25_001113 [Saitozyma podzolica]|uniref:Extracellular membrane protein CFEM domain-containing protein n=1 Tax=Saitozyma podzolica TaxID=1890683 RepID=A0A427YHF0_9TREE|nr:hypothetical protein EHS25_001113 [Saitozyma podzolica]